MMRPLSAYCPQLAREETKVIELRFGSESAVRPVAFVERYCDQAGCDCRRVTLQLIDIRVGDELAAVGFDFDADLEADDERRAVYFERTSRGDIEAHLLRAIVEGFVRFSDYPATLKRHYDQFREAVERGESPNSTGDTRPTNGATQPLKDYAAAMGDVDLNEMRGAWEEDVETPQELNRILTLFFDARRGYGAAFSAARAILEGLGIDLDRQQVVDAADEVTDTRYYPQAWREVVEQTWTVERPLVEVILPLVAEALWNRWSTTPRPHLISKLIAGGYDDRYERGAEAAFERWKEAWGHVEVWIDARGGIPQHRTVTGVLDVALDIAESSANWLNDLGRAVRVMLRDGGVDEKTAVAAVDLLASISARLTDEETVLVNNLDAARYASLRDLGRDQEARRLLKLLSSRPTEDTYAGLFLAHLSELWDYETTDEERDLMLEFIDATLKIADADDGRLLREVRDKLRG